MRIAITVALLATLVGGVVSLAAPSSAQSLAGASLRAGAFLGEAPLVEEIKSRRVRVARRNGYRRPYYVPYACSRPYKYYYWQFFPPICTPL